MAKKAWTIATIFAVVLLTLSAVLAGPAVLPQILATPAAAGPSECPPGQNQGCTLYHKVNPGQGCREAWFPDNANPQGWQPGPCPAPAEGVTQTPVPTREPTATLPPVTNTPVPTATGTPPPTATSTTPPPTTRVVEEEATPQAQFIAPEEKLAPAGCSCCCVQIQLVVDGQEDLEWLPRALEILKEHGYGCASVVEAQ